jgi:hypothetical protein
MPPLCPVKVEARSPRAKDCQFMSQHDEYRATDAHLVAAARAMRH